MFNNTYKFELTFSLDMAHLYSDIYYVMSIRGAAGCSMASKCFMKEYIRANI